MMIKRVLYYTWYENSKDDTLEAWARLGLEVFLMDGDVADYDSDPVLEARMCAQLEQQMCDFIFTYDYFPFITSVAERMQIPYVSWIYDCPHHTLYSKKVISDWNYIFTFDRVQCQELRKRNVVHVSHLPLAVNQRRLNKQLRGKTVDEDMQISFIGSLYDNCFFNQIHYLPEYLSGFLDALLTAQKNIWGYDFFAELLTVDRVKELSSYVKIPLDDRYDFSEKNIFVDLMNEKRTSMDRIENLSYLAEVFPVDLYSTSRLSLPSGIRCHGTVTYMQEMPQVFRGSKINLNFTLRSITSGIPLRALDIMGAGGFLISNIQPELTEYFDEGKDFVAFSSKEELLDLCTWYLEHEEERQRICRSGYEKVGTYFSYEQQLKKILKQLDCCFFR